MSLIKKLTTLALAAAASLAHAPPPGGALQVPNPTTKGAARRNSSRAEETEARRPVVPSGAFLCYTYPMRFARLLTTTAALAVWLPLFAADPTTPIHWSAAKTQELAREAKAKMTKEAGMGVSRLMDSAFIVHREKTSQAEAHATQADYLIVNEGAGTILVGGRIVNGKTERPGEIRGDSIEGGTPYPVKVGDTLFVPKAMPHQFQVSPGGYIVYTVVKITPVE